MVNSPHSNFFLKRSQQLLKDNKTQQFMFQSPKETKLFSLSKFYFITASSHALWCKKKKKSVIDWVCYFIGHNFLDIKEILLPFLGISSWEESFFCCHHKPNYLIDKWSMLILPQSVSTSPEVQKWLAAAEWWPSHNRTVWQQIHILGRYIQSLTPHQPQVQKHLSNNFEFIEHIHTASWILMHT